MAFFGPRLDRPSAVGTEGRPRATSLSIASVVVVALFVLVGWRLGNPTRILEFGGLVGFTVAGAALQTRERLVHRFVGHLCFLPFGTAIVWQLLGLQLVEAGITIAGFVLAMVALGLTWANVGNREGFHEATVATGVTYLSLFVWIVAFALVTVTYGLVFSALGDGSSGVAPLLSFVAFGAALAVCAGAVWLALSALPILQLTPRAKRDGVRTGLARLRQLTALVAIFAAIAAVIGLVVQGYAGRALFVDPADPLGQVFLVLGSPLLIGALVVVATLALLAAIFAKALRLVTTHLDAATGRVVTAMAAAGVFFALIALVLLIVPGLVGAAILATVFLAPILLLLALGLLLALVEFDVLPDRAGGPAVAAAGLFVATLGAGLAHLSAPVVFATAAGALVVWDVSTYGLGVTAELGHLPETRRLELFHGVLAVGVGALAVGGLWALVVGRRFLRVDAGAPAAAAVIVVGLLLLAALLRG